MLKFGGVVIDWLFPIWKQAWGQREGPEEWKKAFIGPLLRVKEVRRTVTTVVR